MYRVRPWLYIGKYAETKDKTLLDGYGIGAMLQLADHVPQPGIASLYLAVEDGQPISVEHLRRGIIFLREYKADGQNLLVACGAGISRSTSFALAVLKEEENLSLLDAYRTVLKVHPAALPHYALWDSLCAYYNEQIPYIQMLDESRN
jgi:hypothetical protein